MYLFVFRCIETDFCPIRVYAIYHALLNEDFWNVKRNYIIRKVCVCLKGKSNAIYRKEMENTNPIDREVKRCHFCVNHSQLSCNRSEFL